MLNPLMDSLNEIGMRVSQAPQLILCLDFDGTLAPIVDQPSLAVLSADMRRVVMSLAGHERICTAIISGREVGDLESRVQMSNLIYAGNHGLEIQGRGLHFVEPKAVECREPLQELLGQLSSRLEAVPGALVEDKGLTASVHFRLAAPDRHEDIRQTVHAALASTRHPFLLAAGDMVFDIRPRVYWSKGDAAVWIREQMGAPAALMIYLGDDVTDEDAFAALQEDITVKVGSSAESAAHYHLDNQRGVLPFLEWLEKQMLGGRRSSLHPQLHS
jgi:trehalose 6-phosphate phosphatase